MNILFVVPYTPSAIRVRPYNLIKALTARGHRLTVFTQWTNAQEQADARALADHCHRVIALPLPRWRSLRNSLRALPTRQPLQAHYAWNPALARRLADAIRNTQYAIRNTQYATRTTQYDIIHIEHLRGARYGLSLLHSPFSSLHSPFSIPIVWDSVDCISHLFAQSSRQGRGLFARLITRLELPRTRRYEGWLVHQFDRVLVTSPVDQAALSELAHSPSSIPHSPPPISVLPNGVDLDYFAPADESRQADSLVFSGKMSYHANVTAVLWFCREVLPRIWQERPNVRFWIVGQNPVRQIRRLAESKIQNPKSKIVVTGTVPDIRPYLHRASVAVAPVPYGAGIQNKVLEAMACGTPVVASPQACTAIQVRDEEHLLMAREPAAFAAAVLRLLADPGLRQQIGRAGRAYVQAHHDWTAIAARLEQIYEETLAAS